MVYRSIVNGQVGTMWSPLQVTEWPIEIYWHFWVWLLPLGYEQVGLVGNHCQPLKCRHRDLAACGSNNHGLSEHMETPFLSVLVTDAACAQISHSLSPGAQWG